jgi:hypothetical protein
MCKRPNVMLFRSHPPDMYSGHCLFKLGINDAALDTPAPKLMQSSPPCPHPTSENISKFMDTEFLTQLANQLRINKTPSCRRAINRILEELKKRCETGEYDSPMAAESTFRKLVEDERSCKQAKRSD